MHDSIVVRPYGDSNAYTVVGRNDNGLMTVTHISVVYVGGQWQLEVTDSMTGRHQVMGKYVNLENAVEQLEDATGYAVSQLARSAAHRAAQRAAWAAYTLPDGSVPRTKTHAEF